MSGLPSCFVCGQPVIGLVGQDTAVDTYLLRGGERDQEAVRAKAYGEVHLRCLVESAWGGFWADRLTANLVEARGFRTVAQDGQVSIYRNDRQRENVVVSPDGWVAWVTDDALALAAPAETGVLLPMRHELNLDLGTNSRLAAHLGAALQRDHAFPLLQLVVELDVYERLTSVTALEDGRLEAPTGPGAPRYSHPDHPGHFTTIASYRREFPTTIYKLLTEAGER